MKSKKPPSGISPHTYKSLFKDISQIYEVSLSDGNSNWNKSTLYSNWKIGERIVKVEQGDKKRAQYGDRVLVQLSKDLNRKFGKGFSDRNLRNMRRFYQLYDLRGIHPELSWSHYLLLMLVDNVGERLSIEKHALKGRLSITEFRKFIDKAISGQSGKTGDGKPEKQIKDRLKRPLMALYTYRVLKNFSADLENSFPNLDLGFSVKMDNALGDIIRIKIGAIVRVVRKG